MSQPALPLQQDNLSAQADIAEQTVGAAVRAIPMEASWQEQQPAADADYITGMLVIPPLASGTAEQMHEQQAQRQLTELTTPAVKLAAPDCL